MVHGLQAEVCATGTSWGTALTNGGLADDLFAWHGQETRAHPGAAALARPPS